MTKEYRQLSGRVKKLLDMQESYDVDFKESLSGLDASDLVAFANSENGGALLIGVEERAMENGCQRGDVVGCEVSDRDRQAIFSKAESCVPPVDVEVIVENSRHRPFFRIEVPSGPSKPYCTSRGTYVTRGDGRVTPLFPEQLLVIFRETEGRRFYENLRQAYAGTGEDIKVGKQAKLLCENSLQELVAKVDLLLDRTEPDQKH